MNSNVAPVDARLVFRVYAIAAWVAGGLLYAWGGLLFRVPLAGLPLFSDWMVPRIVGAVLVGIGFLTFAVARTLDEDGRRRALGWWAIGHAAMLLGVGLQLFVFVGPNDLGWGGAGILGWLAAVTYLFADFWYTADGIPWGGLQVHDSVLEELRRPTVGRLRSTYEEKIREAASQEERHRLARDLHDSIKQQIFVMHTAAATAQARFDADPAGSRAAIDQVRDSAREAMAEMEAMLDQLRAAPLENNGLVEALKKQCEALRFRTGADVQLSVGELPPSETLPVGAQQVIFRVAQEALANVGRHARATRVTVTLESSPISVQLRVDDDGIGFDPEQHAAGMGLGNMRSRVDAVGGRVAITSEPGKGTLVRVSIPHAPVDSVNPAMCRRRALLWNGATAAATALLLGGFSRDHDRVFLALNGAFLLILYSQSIRVTAAYVRARKSAAKSA
jgi:signal transduction histidine kinase